MCGRFEQSETRAYYARSLGVHDEREWLGGDTIAQFNLSPGQAPLMLHMFNGKLDSDRTTWGYRTPEEAAAKRKPWINARVEKALTGRYFRHMFREGRVIIPGGGWFEWLLENGKKQPWYITRKTGEPIFMAGITNFKPYTEQNVEVGFVIVTQDCEGGLVDIHDRRPIVLETEDPGAGWIPRRQWRRPLISPRRVRCPLKPSPGGGWTGRLTGPIQIITARNCWRR